VTSFASEKPFIIPSAPSHMTQPAPVTRPFVSVVTPFYNTAPYLAECIESVLAQTYPEFEYILMDNCSTDGSGEIAEDYARRDSRIHLTRCSEFLSQLANYNRALAKISPVSKYCKMVQADDWIFPDCLKTMVSIFEQSASTGLVSSYWLTDEENSVLGSGYPVGSPIRSGRECAQWYMRTGIYIFGSQTTVMYRSSLVRKRRDFYDTSLPYGADIDKCMEILARWDFGFAYQVLSFTRRDNDSIISKVLPLLSYELTPYIVTQRYAPVFFAAGEAAIIKGRSKQKYYRALARAALQLKGRAFWRYHRGGLKTLSERETLDWLYLAAQMGAVLLWLILNPGRTMLRTLNYYRSSVKESLTEDKVQQRRASGRISSWRRKTRSKFT
jgi:glycosyltransferase involved in cell wall biosynthesis